MISFEFFFDDLLDIVAHITFAKFQPLGALLRSQQPVPRLPGGSKNGFSAFTAERLDLEQSHVNLNCRATKNTP